MKQKITNKASDAAENLQFIELFGSSTISGGRTEKHIIVGFEEQAAKITGNRSGGQQWKR